MCTTKINVIAIILVIITKIIVLSLADNIFSSENLVLVSFHQWLSHACFCIFDKILLSIHHTRLTSDIITVQVWK